MKVSADGNSVEIVFDVSGDSPADFRQLVLLLDGLIVNDDCWDWTKCKDAWGYGKVTATNAPQRVKMAHRVAYELMVGPIPEGLVMDHLCRNRGCSNPNHLEPVSNRENILRSENPAAKNARKSQCSRGHLFTEDNTARRDGHRSCRQCARDRKKR